MFHLAGVQVRGLACQLVTILQEPDAAERERCRGLEEIEAAPYARFSIKNCVETQLRIVRGDPPRETDACNSGFSAFRQKRLP